MRQTISNFLLKVLIRTTLYTVYIYRTKVQKVIKGHWHLSQIKIVNSIHDESYPGSSRGLHNSLLLNSDGRFHTYKTFHIDKELSLEVGSETKCLLANLIFGYNENSCHLIFNLEHKNVNNTLTLNIMFIYTHNVY